VRFTVQATVLLLCGAAAGFAQSGAPAIDPSRGVQNAGNFQAGESVAPGSFVAIFGTNIASTLTEADTIPLSNSLANVSVTFNNVPAPMVAVGHDTTPDHDDQINAQLPWNVLNGGQSGTAQVVVTRNGVPSAPANVPIVPAAPGLMIGARDNGGVLRPVAYNNSDSTFAYPASAFAGSGLPVRPAKVNDPTSLVLLATGLGAVTFTPPNGSPPVQNGKYVESDTLTKPTVLVGGVQANVIFSGLSPQYPSLYQVNIILDKATPTGDAVPIVIQMNGLQSRSDLMIAVTN
jgi:uncharacterized protein (TIGR03437 family)